MWQGPEYSASQVYVCMHAFPIAGSTKLMQMCGTKTYMTHACAVWKNDTFVSHILNLQFAFACSECLSLSSFHIWSG